MISQDPHIALAPDSIRVESPSFSPGKTIPLRYTGLGQGLFPPLRWFNVPTHTQELALVVEDADAPLPFPIIHAIMYGIDPGSIGLAEGIIPGHRQPPAETAPAEFKIGRNSFRSSAWLAPHPLTGHGTHRYFFQLFALDKKLGFTKSPSKRQLLRAIRGHVIARGSTVGISSDEG
ncbi:MAG TPA: YbhB/YbcL family Raf kinase inhibitor-like protein [Candidatus Eremiobacteraceae bacterium]|nr:YbhB/YbcL family Raf kinase inhibitor-like protein [Candidatus Eremiobacteraceae bacterium]